MWTGHGLFTIYLKSIRLERIGDFNSNFRAVVVPHMSFCTLGTTSDLLIFQFVIINVYALKNNEFKRASYCKLL